MTGTLALALAALAGTAILGLWFLAEELRQRPQPSETAVGLAATRLTQLVQRVLPFWFAAIAAWHGWGAISHGWTGFDAVIYYRGSAAWLAGHDPWSAFASNPGSGSEAPQYFAGTPTTVLAFAPFTILPEQVFAALMVAASAMAAVAIVRTLRLAWWWLLFPPLVDGVISANPDIVMLALLVTRWPLAQALGAMIKVYAVIPLLGERRYAWIVLFLAATAATVVLWPSLWSTYAQEFGAISARLAQESDHGVWQASPILLGVVALAVVTLAVLDRRTAGWLAVPALWPAIEFHYATLALPVVTPWLAFVLAVPQPGIPAVAVVVVSIAAVVSRDSRASTGRSEADARATTQTP